MALLRAGRLSEADAHFRAALATHTGGTVQGQALLGLGIIAHQSGNFADALAWFDQSLAVDPLGAAAHVNRGNSLAAMQRHAEAISAFESALLLAPELPSALANMASALNALGRLDEAIAALERADSRQPDSPELLNNLGNLLKDQGRLPDAIACYRRALDINPMTPQAFSNLLAALRLDSSISSAQLLVQHRAWSHWFEAVSTEAP